MKPTIQRPFCFLCGHTFRDITCVLLKDDSKDINERNNQKLLTQESIRRLEKLYSTW